MKGEAHGKGPTESAGASVVSRAKRIYTGAGVVMLWCTVVVSTAAEHSWIAAFNPKRWLTALFGH